MGPSVQDMASVQLDSFWHSRGIEALCVSATTTVVSLRPLFCVRLSSLVIAMPTIVTPRFVRFRQYYDLFDTQSGYSIFTNTDSYPQIGNDTTVGTSNPNWRQQVSRKQDASTAYIRDSCKFVHCYLSGDYRTPYVFNGVNHYYNSRGFTSVVEGFDLRNNADDTSLRDVALARLKKRLSAAVGSFDGLAPTVELREMRGLIRTIASSGTDLVKALIAIKKTKGKSAYHYASKAWLTWSFAIKPTLSDVAKASEAVAAYLERRDLSLKLSGTASKRWTTSFDYGVSTGAYQAPYRRWVEAEHTLSYRYLCSLDLALKSGNNYGLDDHFGFELGALPSTAWELFPFSWLADYFGTVGAYLGDTFVIPPGSTRYLILQKKYQMVGKIFAEHKPFAGTFGSFKCVPGQLLYTRYDRTPLTSLPHLSLRLKTVDEIGVNAVNRLLNLAALLGSSRKR